ncbi:MAG: hypothetical protein ACRD3K_02430, partial [Edaphobacter sp.]
MSLPLQLPVLLFVIPQGSASSLRFKANPKSRWPILRGLIAKDGLFAPRANRFPTHQKPPNKQITPSQGAAK